MKWKWAFIALITLLLIALLIQVVWEPCNRRKEVKRISKARKEVQKITSDLNEAVLLTDIAGWDFIADVQAFRETSSQRMKSNWQTIDTFKAKVMLKNKNIPVRYRKRIKSLERRNRELQTRLSKYNKAGKGNWEDFKKLFDYDLTKLESDIQKLTSK